MINDPWRFNFQLSTTFRCGVKGCKTEKTQPFCPKLTYTPPETNVRKTFDVRRSTFHVRRSTFDVEYEYEYEYERSSRRRYLTFVATALSNVRRDGVI